ncbi:hypothetical protein HMF7854_02360 [Sphingomonas ginkgonis]|uniref:Uncharacterized protein n=1 Tax=Sphingomonas ginkgonis TaxID=2315330 RepID=A0A3R9WR44_9SPHN|nr:hypothetical protein [Sphingomonas ginkgonis]RST29795.1 hypothetical protein HMF7854_02360 [Sphingomonas ginkgonis]
MSGQQRGLGLLGWLLLVLLLMAGGAAAAVYGLAHNDQAAQFFGFRAGTDAGSPARTVAALAQPAPAAGTLAAADAEAEARIAMLEERLARVENATQRAEGSAGRADALLVAFAARRAVDRGVPLGYLEGLLVDRFGNAHPNAVSTVITGARDPVRLDQLEDEYEALGPALRTSGPNESWWTATRRELGSLVSIRRSDVPSPRPAATFDRAQARLASGQVDQALAETMRLPGANGAGGWVMRARRYVGVHRALDEIESAALLSGSAR